MVSRRTFIKGVVGAAAAAGAASTGLVAADSLFPYKKPGLKLKEGPFLYVLDEKAKELNVWYQDRMGKEAMVQDFDSPGKGAQVIWNGLPSMLIRLDGSRSLNYQGASTATNLSDGKVYPVVPGTPGIVDDIIGLWGICPHLCCRPNWRVANPKEKWLVYCICHDSLYDPHALVTDKRGDGVSYQGAMWQGGPAKRALPQIPLRKEADGKLIGVPEKPEWYTYCGVDIETAKEG